MSRVASVVLRYVLTDPPKQKEFVFHIDYYKRAEFMEDLENLVKKHDLEPR